MLKIFSYPFALARRLYDWTLAWAKSPYSLVALGGLSIAESSVFPIPPDALLIALCAGAHRKWMKFALVTSVCSVLGGAIGYALGFFAYESIGYPVMSFVAGLSGDDPERLLEIARFWFNEKEVMGFQVGPWAVGAAGFTPIPYKVFTISAGFFHMDFGVFLVASALSRSARFFLVAGLVGALYRRYGDRVTEFIDKRFNQLAVAFLALLLAGFWLIRAM